MRYEIQELNWNNFETFQEQINNISKNEEFSALTYLSWSYYGTKISYIIDVDVIYLFGVVCIETQIQSEIMVIKNNLNSQAKKVNVILCPIVKNKDNIKQYIDKSISMFKEIFPEQKEIFYENFPLDNHKYHEILEWNACYIYETEQLKTFAGKKMQKKRSNLNNFVKNFGSRLSIKKYDNSLRNTFLDFCKKEIESSDESGVNEINVYSDLLQHFNPKYMSGLILYLDQEVIGVTFGIINNDFYEIFIERCKREYRGAYQYLLSKNLIENNINTKFINRQDDADKENIRKSKESYHPIKVTKSKIVKISI